MSQVYFQSEYPTDLTELNEAGGALVIDYRVVEQPTELVELRMDCKYPCSGSTRFTKVLSDSALGQWTQKAIPVACFEQAGTNLAGVDTAFVIATTGSLTIEISKIALSTTPSIKAGVSCADMVNDNL